MAATKRNAMLIAETRHRVQISQLINRLQDHADGKCEMSPTQVRAAEILLKKALFRYPIVGQAFQLAQFIPVDRSRQESAIASLEKAIEAMRIGQSFLIYPEGTRSPDGRLQEFKKGAVVMAIKAGVPIVPIACSGAHRVMRKQSLEIHPGEILVEFLEPIEASKYSFDERETLNEIVHHAMAAGLPPDQRPIGFPGAS